MAIDIDLLDARTLQLLGNPSASLLELDRMDAEERFADFVALCWSIVVPDVRKWGKAFEVVCDAFQDISDGKIRRFLGNEPPGFSKPVAETALIDTPHGPKLLRDIVVGDRVLTHRGRYREVTAVHLQGDLPVVQVDTWNGRTMLAAHDHPVLTAAGWVPAAKLTSRDTCASVAPIPTEDVCGGDMSPETARLLGYLVGDGSVAYSGTVFTNADHEILADFEHCAAQHGFVVKRRHRFKHEAITLSLSCRHDGSLQRFLEHHGLRHKTSYTKRVPATVRAAGRVAAANFLGAYWSCDGMLAIRHQRETKTAWHAKLTTVSGELARDTQSLMMRLGIPTRIRVCSTPLKTKRQGDRYVSFIVQATDQDSVAKVASLPGLCSRKRIDARRRDFDAVLYPDPVVGVRDVGMRPCRCLTVDEDASFVADGLAVHNSVLSGVFWPAWEWGPRRMTHVSHLGLSYNLELAGRDNHKCKMLITSPLYQALWPHVKIAADQAAKKRFLLEGGGGRGIAMLGAPGWRAHRVVVDDPNVPNEGEADRRATRQAIAGLASRLADPKTSAIVLMQHRTAADDASSVALEAWKEIHEFEHLCLPMRYSMVAGEIRAPRYPSKREWRTQPGELLCADRYGETEERELRGQLRSEGGRFMEAALLDQDPMPEGGGIYPVEDNYYPVLDALPPGAVKASGWDLAATENQHAAATARVLLARVPLIGQNDAAVSSYSWVICDVREEHANSLQVRQLVRSCAEDDGFDVVQSLPQDPGQAGKDQAASMAGLLSGYRVHTSPETGSKVERAAPAAAQAHARNLYMLRADWNARVRAALRQFPHGAKDVPDALSRAFAVLTPLGGATVIPSPDLARTVVPNLPGEAGQASDTPHLSSPDVQRSPGQRGKASESIPAGAILGTLIRR